MINIKQALRDAITLLTPTSSSPQRDAEVLLAHILNKPSVFLYTYPELTLESSQEDDYQKIISQRQEGVPVAYLTGHREFWSLPLKLSKDTLIPRPETELLVEQTLKLLSTLESVSILELGTGSGAIALALASERPNWNIMACDINEGAVDIARENAKRLGLKNIKFICSDWFSNIPSQLFDAIVSNPPYIASNDPHLQKGDLRFEPKQALISGTDGMIALTQIIKNSADYLRPDGFLLLEHGFQQKQAVSSLLDQCHYTNIQNFKDWQGCDRVSLGFYPKN